MKIKHIRGLKRLQRNLDKKKGENLRREVALFMEAAGFQFLEEIQNQIIVMGVVDTRRLLNSFDKGNGDGVWVVRNGGLTLEIGTNLKYAQYVNDGHFQSKRWVPGKWIGDRFEYDPNAKTGMMLTAKWIEGRPYWDNALAIYQAMFPIAFKRKFRQWVEEMGT